MCQGFARSLRLLNAQQFKCVFDAPDSRASGRDILLLARKNQLEQPRLGMVIGKKSVKLAVQRNRLKRLIRTAFRLNQKALAGLDIVVLARKGLAEQDNAEFTRQLESLWQRLLRKLPKAAGGATHA